MLLFPNYLSVPICVATATIPMTYPMAYDYDTLMNHGYCAAQTYPVIVNNIFMSEDPKFRCVGVGNRLA